MPEDTARHTPTRQRPEVDWNRGASGSQAAALPPVGNAAAPPDQAVPLKPVGEPGQRALRQVHRVGDVLRTRGLIVRVDQVVEYLEVADAEAVRVAQLALEGIPGGDLGGDERVPGGPHRFVALRLPGIRPGGCDRCHTRECSPPPEYLQAH